MKKTREECNCRVSNSDYISIKLYQDNDKESFFSKNFTGNDIFKELLVNRYLRNQRYWRRLIDNGMAVSKRNFLKYAARIEIDQKEILLIYKEKGRKKSVVVLYDGTLYITKDIKSNIFDIEINNMQLSVNGETEDSICLSVSMIQFLYDLKLLFEYKQDGYFHPVRNLSYKKREIYSKALILAVMQNKTMTAKQIFHLTDVMQDFGIASKDALLLIKMAYRFAENEIEEIYHSLIKCFEPDDKKNFVADITYLILCGNYDISKKNKMKQKFLKDFGLNEREIDSRFYKIEKEYFKYE